MAHIDDVPQPQSTGACDYYQLNLYVRFCVFLCVGRQFTCLLCAVNDFIYCVVYVEGGSNKRRGGKGAKKNKPGPVFVDHNYLASGYYGTSVAGLSLVRDLPQALG